MVLPLASRFAVLSVDDDDEGVKKNAKNPNKKKPDSKQLPNQSKPKQEANKKQQKNKKPENQATQNQPAKNKSKSASQKKKRNADDHQWELWKEKDAQFVDGNYENELHQAILLSQLDYEEKKEVYEQIKKEQEVEKKNLNVKKKKGSKTQTMSLSEFNSLPDSLVKEQEEGGGGGDADAKVNGQPDADPEFFERVRQDAKKVFNNEKVAEKRKAQEPFINDAITIAQFEDQIERRDKEIVELKKEISKLKEELQDVRKRNKSLCHLLGQGEMKDKAEVLIQMEKTQKVKDELSSEVSRLHALLEQERSKVRALTGDKTKGKSKKRTASENQ